ncbi:RimJ/RimL family protein N-acetyltransferase [Crossiella equi]|uniref:Lysine N-acyltransferase MbtK n=1 Tax=Crossiella equi TaxID=130796 RepID=A0ABS5AN72_9PSEU|nr:GNAT family N-acetyltransferase [Crossiella equi]MBP2477837.1 RimJ/RimL family protein N-acetyltransferase [Crossiella equi]
MLLQPGGPSQPGGLARELPCGRFSLRRLDPVADLDLLHTWMHDPAVAEFWEMAKPKPWLAGYLREQCENGWCSPCLGLLDGEPMSYWELYDPVGEGLARHYPARPGDVGLHLLLGPSSARGRGLGTPLLRTVTDWQLAQDERVHRVVAEPDVRNLASIRVFERAGYVRHGELDLPVKRAAFMIRETPGTD